MRPARPPRDWVVGGTWPSGRFAVDAPAAAAVLAHAAAIVAAAVDESSVDEVAAAAGLHPRTVRSVVDGLVWPRLETLVALDAVMAASIWPEERF